MSGIARAIADRGPDKLLESVFRLRCYAEELRYKLHDELQAALPAAEALHSELGKLEGLVVNMQTSCVRLPDSSRTNHRIWVVPVMTEPWAQLSAYRNANDVLPNHRCFRLEFWRDGGGPTWKWRLDERELDTGIPTR